MCYLSTAQLKYTVIDYHCFMYIKVVVATFPQKHKNNDVRL